MILWSFGVATGGGDLSFTADINFPPSDVSATAGISALGLYQPGFPVPPPLGLGGVAGFLQFQTVDPDGKPTRHDLFTDNFSYLELTPILFAAQCNSITFLVGGTGDPANSTHIQGTCQIYFVRSDGSLT